MDEYSNLSPLKILVTSGIGLSVGLVITMVDANSTAESLRFVASTQFVIWLSLILLQTTLWALLLSPIFKSLKYFKACFAHHKSRILPPTFLLVLPLILYAVSYSPEQPMFAHLRVKVIILTIIGYSIALLAVIGIWLVQIALLENFRNSEDIEEDSILLFLDLHKYLRRFLGIAGIIIGIATLSTGALGNARMAIEPNVDTTPEITIIYGAFFSGLLALAYLPTYLTFQAKGRVICETIFPMPSPKSERWDNWFVKQTALAKLLKLEINARDSFEAGVSILAPLFGGVISFLLGS